MKRAARWSCLLIFLILCTVTVWFLQSFTESKESEQPVQYIDWQSAVKIEADGSETPYTQEDYANLPEKGDSFRFTALLPTGMDEGNLLFETSGLELTVELNGEQIWNSSAKTPEGAVNQTQAVIPLPENASGELVMTCTVQEETISMFPPMPRVESLAGTEAFAYAYANFYGIPAGASAIVMLLVAGLFLLGVLRRRIDWSLIPLFLAAVGLTVRWISQGLGYYFLPEAVQLERHRPSHLRYACALFDHEPPQGFLALLWDGGSRKRSRVYCKLSDFPCYRRLPILLHPTPNRQLGAVRVL